MRTNSKLARQLELLVFASPAIAWALISIMAYLEVSSYAVAQGGTIEVGTTIQDVLIAYVGVVGTLVTALVSWLLWKIKQKTGIEIDTRYAENLGRFARNAAGQLLAQWDSVRNIKFDVNNKEISRLANEALARIPDTLNYFGVGPANVEAWASKYIIAELGKMTATEPDADAPAAQPAAPAAPTGG